MTSGLDGSPDLGPARARWSRRLDLHYWRHGAGRPQLPLRERAVSGVLIQGNKADITALGNGSHGVFITGTDASFNTVGGKVEVTLLAFNTIAFNGGDGVLIGSEPAPSPFIVAAGPGNAVLDNRIFNNALDSPLKKPLDRHGMLSAS